jgi:hypothetical protein
MAEQKAAKQKQLAAETAASGATSEAAKAPKADK